MHKLTLFLFRFSTQCENAISFILSLITKYKQRIKSSKILKTYTLLYHFIVHRAVFSSLSDVCSKIEKFLLVHTKSFFRIAQQKIDVSTTRSYWNNGKNHVSVLPVHLLISGRLFMRFRYIVRNSIVMWKRKKNEQTKTTFIGGLFLTPFILFLLLSH